VALTQALSVAWIVTKSIIQYTVNPKNSVRKNNATFYYRGKDFLCEKRKEREKILSPLSARYHRNKRRSKSKELVEDVGLDGSLGVSGIPSD